MHAVYSRALTLIEAGALIRRALEDVIFQSVPEGAERIGWGGA